MWMRVLAAVLALVFASTGGAQQVPVALSPKALAVKGQADRLAPKDHISVVPRHGEEEFGTFLSNNATAVTFYDIDQKREVTLEYEALKKIKKGYGGYNTANHRHVDRERNFLIAAALLGGLFVIVFAAARS